MGMAKQPAFALVYADEVKQHLRAIETKYHSLIQSEIVCRMKIASVADVKARLSAYLKDSREGPVVVTQNGKAVAVLLAVTDADELERLVLAHSPKFQALLDKSRRQIQETGGIPHDVFWREVQAQCGEDAKKTKRGHRQTANRRRHPE